MSDHTYATAAVTPGNPGSGHSPSGSPAEETRCPVVAHEWINDEYKHLVVKATPKALAAQPGQFFHLLCPSPDEGEVWFRRPQSVYRVARSNVWLRRPSASYVFEPFQRNCGGTMRLLMHSMKI